MTLSVLVPIYNEDETVLEILRRVSAVPIEKEIIVVDDGSHNAIAPIIEAAAIPDLRLIVHAQNRGKGAAIRTGLAVLGGFGTGVILYIVLAVVMPEAPEDFMGYPKENSESPVTDEFDFDAAEREKMERDLNDIVR